MPTHAFFLRWPLGLLVAAALLRSLPAPAQNRRLIDSLQRAAATQTDTAKAWTLTRLAWEYRPYNQAKALALNNEALQLAIQAHWPEQQGFCWMALGNVYMFHEQDAPALRAYQTAEPLLRRGTGSRAALRRAQLHYNWGLLLYERLNDRSGAVRHHTQALRVYERLGRLREQANSLNAIGNDLYDKRWATGAFEYYRQAEAMAQRSGDLKAQLAVMNDYYGSYIGLYSRQPKPEYLQIVIPNLARGVALIRRHPGEVSPQYLPTFLTNLAEAYAWKGEGGRARRLVQESIRLAQPLSSSSLLAHDYSMLAWVAAAEHRAARAQAATRQATGYLARCSLEDQAIVMQRLQKAAALVGDWQGAHGWLLQYTVVQDSLAARARHQLVLRLTLQYEVEKRDMSIQKLRREAGHQRRQALLLAGLGLLLLLGAAALLYSSRLRRRLAEQQQRGAEQQAVLARQEKLLAQQQQGQLRQEVDFKHRELTTSALNLERKNELLLALRKELEQVPETGAQLKPAFRLIDQNLRLGDDLGQFRRHFEGVHPDFFHRLGEQAQGPLSGTELRYCAYLRLGLSTKEMASLLRIEPHSVRVGKHRLKQRLHLSKDTDLEQFINNI